MSDELEPLDPGSRSLLSALPSPPLPPELKARLWARVEASALALPPVTTGASGPSVAPAAKAVGVGAAGKLVVPAIIGALVAGAGGGIAIDRALRTPEEKVAIRYIDIPRQREVVTPPAPPAPEPVAPVVTPPPTVMPKPKPAAVAVASAEERNLVELARTALLKREPAGALDAVAQHRRKFAKGQLNEEVDALEVQAFAQAGRADEASAAAKRFRAKYPHSVFEDAVRAALK